MVNSGEEWLTIVNSAMNSGVNTNKRLVDYGIVVKSV